MSSPKLWIKIFFSLTAVFVGALVFVVFPQSVYAGTLSCSVTTQAICNSTASTTILRMSGATNAHAELPGQANANYDANVVCCGGVTGLGNSCSGTFATVLKLFGANNAHVEQTGSYASSSCISVSSGSVSIGYQATNCSGFDTTIGSISGTTNAHIGDGAAYITKICGTATGSPPPTLTSYSNSTDSGLDWATSCTGCGARIGGGSIFRQTVVITGTNFGADPGAGNRSTATNNVKVGSQQIATSNVIAWSAISITFLTDSAVAGDTDVDWGADFGGASALTVTAGGATSAGFNFYVFPQVTGVSPCDKAGFPPGNNAREYNAADSTCPNGLTDGEIFIDGTRFGTTQTGGWARILGCDATTCSGPTGSATTTSWGNTSITVQIPTVISDSVYTGSLIMQQGSGSNNKQHTYTASGFRVLPRIISNTQTADIVGNRVKITGNHFCQAGAANCPVSPNRSSASDNVKFGSTQALDSEFVNSGASPCSGNAEAWINTEICVKVPVGTPFGSQPTMASSSSYSSNTMAFTVQSTVPNAPTDLNQFKENGTTIILAGGTTASSTVVLKATSTAGVSIDMALQVEVKSTGTSFNESGIVQGPTCSSCISTSTAVNVTGLSNGTKHWRARTINTGTNSTSTWVYYGTDNINETDFNIDITAPDITFVPTDDCNGNSSGATTPGPVGSNSAVIDWSLSETADGQIEYSTSTDLSASVNYPPSPAASSTSQSITLSNLNSGTRYYYKVKSRDGAGNLANRPTAQPYCYFDTASVAQPAKTIKFYAWGKTSEINGGSTASTTFSVVMPENATSTKSAFVEIRGVYDTTGSSPNRIGIQVNSQTTKYYVIPSILSKSHFKIIYEINPVNIDPSVNTIYITPESNTIIYISSVDIYVTYAYTP